MTSAAEPCPVCGFSPNQMSPPDASVAIRSYPRRYRALVAAIDDDEQRALLSRRPAPGEWSAAERVAFVATDLAWARDAIARANRADRPVLSRHRWSPPPAGDAVPLGVDDVLRPLDETADTLASVLEDVRGDDWLRPVVVDSEETTVLALARDAVHTGAHHLRELDRTLRSARATREDTA